MQIISSFFITLILFVFNSSAIFGAKSNFYIHVKNNSIKIGEYKDNGLKPYLYKTYSLSAIDKKEIAEYLIRENGEHVMYYIHCWLGNISIYNKSSIKALQQINTLDKIISIKWEGEGLNYNWNYFNAQKEGRKISELFEYLLKYNKGNNELLGHSMGHSFLTGAIENLQNDHPYFKEIIFASADLTLKAFENELKILPAVSNRITVYVHDQDRLLQMATIKHRGKRLGLINKREINELCKYKNIYFINITGWEGKSTINPSNHTYFKDHSAVMRDFNRIIKK